MSALDKAGSKNSLNPQIKQNLNKVNDENRSSVASAGEEMIYPMENSEFDKHSVHSAHSDARSHGGKSKKSATTSVTTDSSITNGNGKQIADTLVRKFMFMYATIISFIMHILYLTALLLMSKGWVLPFNATQFHHVGPIVFEIWAVLCHAILDVALNDGLAAFLGFLLSQPDGYSIAACGFVHADFLGKLRFPNRLSFRSTAKPFLTKVSLIWLFHGLMLLVAIVASTSIHAEKSRVNSGSLMCLLYSQNYLHPIDRGIPTMQQEMGVAELIDGTALGFMRASDPTLLYSQHIIPPQLTDACQDGSTIIGSGFSSDIYSSCHCTDSSSRDDLLEAGFQSDEVTQAVEYASRLAHTPGLINSLKLGKDYINITTILTGVNICGGANRTSPAVAVCINQIKNHATIGTLVTYKTDGTPASIAAKSVVPQEIDGLEVGPANITWLFKGLEYLLGNNISYNMLPPHWPGSINPMLWMLSENMHDASIGLLEPGMETTVALMLRAAIQRSYTVSGGFCTQNIVDPETVTIVIDSYGLSMAVFWITFQLILNMVALISYIPWLLSRNPILPAVQAAQDPMIFSLLSSKNAITTSRMNSMPPNIDENLMWPKLDIVLRIGESILTAEDPERGVVLMDKPKMVTDMSFDKVYV